MICLTVDGSRLAPLPLFIVCTFVLVPLVTLPWPVSVAASFPCCFVVLFVASACCCFLVFLVASWSGVHVLTSLYCFVCLCVCFVALLWLPSLPVGTTSRLVLAGLEKEFVSFPSSTYCMATKASALCGAPPSTPCCACLWFLASRAPLSCHIPVFIFSCLHVSGFLCNTKDTKVHGEPLAGRCHGLGSTCSEGNWPGRSRAPKACLNGSFWSWNLRVSGRVVLDVLFQIEPLHWLMAMILTKCLNSQCNDACFIL